MRIVSLVPSATETLYELGLEDQIAGITTFCKFPKDRVALKPKVGGTKNPDLQKILELKPDVVLVNEEENRKQDAEFLRDHGIALHVTFPNSIEEAVQTIRDMGIAFGAQESADALCEEILNRMVKYSRPVARRAVIFIWRRPYMTVNATTYVDSVCRFFGFDNVFAQAPERYPRLEQQQIREANPEVALFPDEPYVFQEKDLDEFRSLYPDVDAVRNNRLLLFDGTYVTWHGYGTLRTLREFPAALQRASWSAGFQPAGFITPTSQAGKDARAPARKDATAKKGIISE